MGFSDTGRIVLGAERVGGLGEGKVVAEFEMRRHGGVGTAKARHEGDFTTTGALSLRLIKCICDYNSNRQILAIARTFSPCGFRANHVTQLFTTPDMLRNYFRQLDPDFPEPALLALVITFHSMYNTVQYRTVQYNTIQFIHA